MSETKNLVVVTDHILESTEEVVKWLKNLKDVPLDNITYIHDPNVVEGMTKGLMIGFKEAGQNIENSMYALDNFDNVMSQTIKLSKNVKVLKSALLGLSFVTLGFVGLAVWDKYKSKKDQKVLDNNRVKIIDEKGYDVYLINGEKFYISRQALQEIRDVEETVEEK